MKKSKIHIDSGKTNYAWVTYKQLIGDKEQHLQVVHWPNGEGFTVYRPNESLLEMDWDEFNALKTAIKAADSVKE
jgi:hypothetical protein